MGAIVGCQGKMLYSLALPWEAVGLRDYNTLPFCHCCHWVERRVTTWFGQRLRR